MRARSWATVALFAAMMSIVDMALAYDAPGISREQAPPPSPGILTKAPSLLKSVDAEVPTGSLAPGTSAEVVLIVDITEKGLVGGASVSVSASPELDEAAKTAVLKMEFSPAEIDGIPAPVRIEYRYRFEAPPLPVAVAEPEIKEKPINFKGRVLERGSRDPLRGAVVFLPDQNLSATCDADGRFELRGVTPGKVRVQITEPTHRRYEIIEEVAENQVVELTAYLMRNIASGKEIVIIGEREKKDVVKRVMHKEELRTVPGTFGDPLRVLQSLPGLARMPFISGALLIRGSRPNDSSVMIDGVPVPQLFHFGAGPSVINPSFVEQINLYPGVFGAKYGHAIGGVVDVDTHIPAITRTHGELKVDLLDTGAYIETPLGDQAKYGTLSLAGRRSYIDVLLPLFADTLPRSGSRAPEVIPYYWDYQARYAFVRGDRRIEATVFGSYDIMKIQTYGEVRAQDFSLNREVGFHRMRVAWSEIIGGWRVSVAPMIGVTPSTTDFNDIIKLNLTESNAGLKASARKDITPDLQVELGTDTLATQFALRFETAGQPTQANPNPAPSVREQRVFGAASALYAEASWMAYPAWKLIPGLRIEEYKLPGGFHTSVEPRLATRYTINDVLTLKGGVGIYRQAPVPQRLDKVVGNPYLGLEESRQAGVGVEWQATNKILLDTQFYYSQRYDLSTSSRDIVFRDGAYVPENFNNNGRGRAFGFELMLKHDVTERLYGWLSYTAARSEEINKTTGNFAPSTFDQTHILSLVASYKFANGWELGTRYRMSTGRPETPIVGATYDVDANRYVPLSGEPGSTRGETFSQWDVRAEKLWTYDTWRLSTYIDLQNVFNSANPEAKLWDYRYGKSEPLRGMPILPVIGLRGEF